MDPRFNSIPKWVGFFCRLGDIEIESRYGGGVIMRKANFFFLLSSSSSIIFCFYF